LPSPQSTPEAKQLDALARILRTEAAISGVSRKAGATWLQSTRLWPRAILKALDSAVAACRWESALEVPPTSALPTSSRGGLLHLLSQLPTILIAFSLLLDL
jgi:hypothetical protein